MKKTIAMIAAVVALGSTAFARNIDVGDLPHNIANSLERLVGRNRIDDVKVRQIPSNKRYVASLRVTANVRFRIFIAPNGRVVSVTRSFNIQRLPQRLRAVVDQYLDDDDEVISVESINRRGQVTYLIRIRTDDDEETRIVLSRDGSVIRADEDLDIEELGGKLRAAIRIILREGGVLVDLDRVRERNEISYRLVIRLSNGNQKIITLDARGRIIDEEDECNAA